MKVGSHVFLLLPLILHEGDGDWVTPPVPDGPYKDPAPKEQKSGAGWRQGKLHHGEIVIHHYIEVWASTLWQLPKI